MFGVGWTEMLVLGVVALIVIGPKDLPVLMNRLGKAVSTIRRMGNEFQREINKASGLEKVTDIRRSITEPLKQTAAEITREFNKPLAGGGVEPSGAIKPKDPKVESVVDEIHAAVGMTPPAKPAETPAPAAIAKPVESPAPAEAIAPAATPAPKPRAKKAAPAPLLDGEPEVKKPAAPRKPRAKKAAAAVAEQPKSEASDG
ncbi:MAG: twin-arginine translocase subunit TatB [Hyphomicrobiales bacterium]|nr:MAG: twin-arginine translocase subunit TatB [Hyphomicrobiales bacterium]